MPSFSRLQRFPASTAGTAGAYCAAQINSCHLIGSRSSPHNARAESSDCRKTPEVSEGRSPPIADPKPAACIAAQTQPSVGFGLRLCGVLRTVLAPRFASLTLPVVSEPLRSKGFEKKAVARRLPPGEPQALGKCAKAARGRPQTVDKPMLSIKATHLAPSVLAVLTEKCCGARFAGSAHTRQGDEGKRVPSGHNAEGVSDPQSSTEASADHGQWAARRLRLRRRSPCTPHFVDNLRNCCNAQQFLFALMGRDRCPGRQTRLLISVRNLPPAAFPAPVPPDPA